MKILLDECLPNRFRDQFPEHEVHTAKWAGFSGRQNGDLLTAADQAGYELLVTIDQGIPHQHNFSHFRIALMVLNAKSNKLEDLKPLIGPIRGAMTTLSAGTIVFVGPQ